MDRPSPAPRAPTSASRKPARGAAAWGAAVRRAAVYGAAVGLAGASVALGCHRAPKDPLLYVSDERGGDVAVVDPNVGRTVERIPVGKRPRGLKVSADGTLLYVALSGSPVAGPGVDESALPPADRSADGIGVVDLGIRKLVRTLQSGQDPEAFDLSPDGKTMYVSNEETAQLTVLDLPSGRVRGRVSVGREPEGVTVRPDGKVVYVTSETDSEVVAVDAATLEVLTRIPTAPRPRAIVFAKDGTTGFVSDELGAAITVLDAATDTAAGTIKLDAGATGPSVPLRPMGEVLSPDGTRLYVSCGRAGSVAVIDVATRRQVGLIDQVGKRPWGLAISPDGRRLFSANGPSNDVSIVDVSRGAVIGRLPAGLSPWGVAMAPAAGHSPR